MHENELFSDRIVVDRVFNTVMRRPFCTFVILCYGRAPIIEPPTHRTERSTPKNDLKSQPAMNFV